MDAEPVLTPSELADVFSEEEALGYTDYSRDWLIKFLRDLGARKMTVEQAICALQDDGCFPSCTICGKDGEEHVFQFGQFIEGMFLETGFYFICLPCRNKFMRAVTRMTRQAGLRGGITNKKLHDQFFEYALLKHVVNHQPMESKNGLNEIPKRLGK